jgi:hypothetical protein
MVQSNATLHLLYEAKLGGLQEYRWMCHIERALKNLRVMVHNKAKVKGCITEEFKLKETTYREKLYLYAKPVLRVRPYFSNFNI